jgi:uncharacterized membrane protein YfcA
MMSLIALIGLGLFAGALSGLIGIGGGVVITPALVLFFGLSQKEAQGTTLAIMVPPVGILAAWTYWKQGFVDMKMAALICVGFLIGGLFGAKFATALSSGVLQKIFGSSLLLIGLKMIFDK